MSWKPVDHFAVETLRSWWTDGWNSGETFNCKINGLPCWLEGQLHFEILLVGRFRVKSNTFGAALNANSGQWPFLFKKARCNNWAVWKAEIKERTNKQIKKKTSFRVVVCLQLLANLMMIDPNQAIINYSFLVNQLQINNLLIHEASLSRSSARVIDDCRRVDNGEG